MITKQHALEILKENIKNENLRKHHYAVAAAMRTLAEFFMGENYGGEGKKLSFKDRSQSLALGNSSPEAKKWEITGLLHDADYEETKDDPEKHADVIAKQLQEEGVDEDIIHAIRAHNYEYLDAEPESLMDWSLVACDDLTGLIVAVALVHPNKLEGVSVESVMKKFGSPSFAAGADRARIKMCEEKLGIPLEDFVGIVLEAMKGISEKLGL